MKKFLYTAIFFFSFLFLVHPVFAQKYTSGQNPILSQNETVDGDYFSAGQVVTISGTVNGDVYTAGGTVIVNGNINGDLLAAGGNVQINGTVANNVRVAGGNVTIGGSIGKNVTILSGNGTINTDAKIGGSVVGAGGSITVLSPIPKSATFGVGELIIGNSIQGNVTAGVGTLTLINGAKVTGNLDYTSTNKVKVQPGASISGKITQHIPPKPATKEPPKEAVWAGIVGWKLFSFLTSLIFGILFLLLIPQFFSRSASQGIKKPWASLGWGFVALIVTPVIIILLFITILGIPFAFILLFAYIMYIWVGKLVASLAIGEIVNGYTHWKIHLILIFLIGLVIVEIVTLIPLLGGLIGFLLTVMGIGALLTQKRETYLILRTKNEV